MRFLIFLFIILSGWTGFAQQRSFSIRNKESGDVIPGATINIRGAGRVVAADNNGFYTGDITDSSLVLITAAGYYSDSLLINPSHTKIEIELMPMAGSLNQVVVTGTMRAVKRTETPVPVEVYSPAFFLKNPTPTLFDALQMINGVRPQLNCNVCSTGDIHINGLEGPYTMILIDGMPIVSSLASVYGLSGIPNSLVERIEVVRGPASSLYGSEAIGGLINVITKNPAKAPLLSVDLSGTSWAELNADLGMRYKIGDKIHGLSGVNYYNYQNPVDKNGDNFTDVTLQHRVSLFNKLQFLRPGNRVSNIAVRYNYEDRWGGEMQWNKNFRGTDSVYGENIYTSRWEIIGNHQLISSGALNFSYSFNSHSQRSAYGNVIFNALQKVGFGQLTWEKNYRDQHQLLLGLVGRYTYYDDNTTVTEDTSKKSNRPDNVFLPGIFIQDEITMKHSQQLLLGLRYDYDKRHGNIFTPRIGYKIGLGNDDIIRINAGTGFRVVNLFTEDHAALTGARAVEIIGDLKPERSFNINLNYLRNIVVDAGIIQLDFSAWYSHFTNRILPDYLADPNKIIYRNLDGHSTSRGISANAEMNFGNNFLVTLGSTLMDVRTIERSSGGSKQSRRQLLTEKWTGTWAFTYHLRKAGLKFDYTGNIYGPMLLPVLSELDPRDSESPVWSIQNIQVTKKISPSSEIYFGIKNLLNWTPAKRTKHLIPRAHDPFDKQVVFDANGRAQATAENPYGFTFDPNYVYAPNQGMRIFAGYRFTFKKKSN